MADEEYRITRYRGKFAVQWQENGNRRRYSLRTDVRSVADQKFAHFLEVRRLKRGVTATVAQIWTGYQLTLEGRPAGETMTYLWKALGPHFGDRGAETLTEDDCREYIAQRREAGRSDGTIWTELSRLRSALKWAQKKRIINLAPHIWMPPPSPPREKRMTREEVEKFKAACTYPHIKLFVSLAASTGARMGAILGLKWSRVNFETGMISFRDPDRPVTKKLRSETPMNPKARALLLEAKKGALTEYVIEWGGQRVLTVKKGIGRAAKDSGMPWVTPHVFRHTAGCLMAEAGIPMEEIAQYLGHKDSKTTSTVYARYSPTYLRKAAESLDF
jgi:integrase